MKIAIIGTGAMGSVYAGVLAEAGHEIWAIDSWADHIEQIKSKGLTLEGASGNRTITNLSATTDADDAPSFDLYVFAR